MPTTWLPPPQFLDISTPLHCNVILVNTKIPLKLNVSQPYNKKFCDFIRFLFCFFRSVLVLGRNSFVWKPNVRTDPTLLYGAICLSTKSLCQVWFNLIQFNPIWSSLIQFDPIWSYLFQFIPISEWFPRKKCTSLPLAKFCNWAFYAPLDSIHGHMQRWSFL